MFLGHEPRFKPPVPVLDRLFAALRRYGQTLPDGRRGQNTSYAMADFSLAAFASFFMQSPSFLAHQRYLETAQACPCEGGGSAISWPSWSSPVA